MSERPSECNADLGNQKERPVSSGAAPPTSVAEASVTTQIEIDVSGQWDALRLMERLIPFHSFLVQHTTEHWVVHAKTPGSHGESLADALDVIEEWQTTRDINASVRVTGHPTRAGDRHRSQPLPHPKGEAGWNA
jgi:hypothetical protein